MSNGSELKWTTGSVLGLLGFVAMVVTAWVNLNGRVTTLESDASYNRETVKELKTDIKENSKKLDKLLAAEGIKPEGVEK